MTCSRTDAVADREFAPWSGRGDGPGPEHARWHSVVRGGAPGESLPEGAVVLVGFASDEGVRRNGGRVGAAAGPAALRQALASLSDPGCPVFDAGDVVAAAEALGLPHLDEGVVVRGEGRGRVLGFPTANVAPPMYSAIKIDGKKLYELARAGKIVQRQARRIEIP